MADKKWSQFPSATPENDDVVVGLHSGGNVRFTVANFVLAVRQGLINLFVPQTRTVNGKALSSDIALTMDDISNGTTYAKTTATQVAQIGTNQTNIGTIEGKIPSAASQSNQLADKAFVTDAITQGTAIFRGSFASKAALLAVAWQTSDPDAPYYVSNNDYAVVLDDETQNDECWRYIYVTGTGWTPQYRINESPMTQAQLDALNSGATAAIINSVADKLDKTGDGKDVTATFTAASTRANISTGEKLSVLFGKIAKWFSDLGTAAFRAATGSITSGSTDLVESGAVYTGLAGKQDAITANGILKGDGAGGVSAATAGTDYQAPLTAGTDYATPAMIPTVPSAYTSNPAMDGTSSPGSSGAWAKGDHVHPSDTSRVPVIGKGKNLLDNSYFVGGGTGRGVFPVNERGQSSYTGLVYGIDRWYSLTTGGILTLGADYITLQAATYNFNWRQTLSRKVPLGSAVTLTVIKGDGSLVTGSGTLSSSSSFVQMNLSSGYIRAYYDYVQITTGANNSNTVKAVWLELGTEQTLAHQEGSAWVLNEIPDYEEELIKCQTSTADSSDTYANKSLATEQQLAYVETGTTASRNYSAGQYICWNGLLYTADINISSGATLSASGGSKNLTETTIGNSLYTSIGYASSSASISSVTGTIVRVGVNYIFNLEIVVGTAIARFVPLVEFSAPTSVRTTATNPAVWIVNHQAAGTQYAGFVSYANSKHVITSSTQLPIGTYSVYAVVTMM